MDASVAELLELLDVRPLGDGIYQGIPSNDPLRRVFGGQLLGQALAAASLTTPPDAYCHSLHAYFLRPGKPGRPIDYEVAVMRDGQRFAARKVVAVQRDEPVFELTASFEADTAGPSHSEPMPDVPLPETFAPEAERMAALLQHMPEHRREFFSRPLPIEYAWVDPRLPTDTTPSFGPVRSWMRIRDRLPDDVHLHRALLAYASDMGALEPALRAVGVSHADPDLALASLDHALWFHRPFRADEWLLFSGWPVSVSAGRGLSRAVVHTREGVHVASLTQEALMRPR
ncbi:MAG: acyl-CoA thioesterase, partial [Pseudomonadota bacterium]